MSIIPNSKQSKGHSFVVASGHRLASLEALKVLKSGGNVVDAAVTGAAVLSVVLPYACGLGRNVWRRRTNVEICVAPSDKCSIYVAPPDRRTWRRRTNVRFVRRRRTNGLTCFVFCFLLPEISFVPNFASFFFCLFFVSLNKSFPEASKILAHKTIQSKKKCCLDGKKKFLDQDLLKKELCKDLFFLRF